MANSSTSWTTGIKTICVSRKSSKKGSTPLTWLPKRVSNKCSNILEGVPDMTVYLPKIEQTKFMLHWGKQLKFSTGFKLQIWNFKYKTTLENTKKREKKAKEMNKKTYLNAECCPLCLATRSKTKTSFPCSCNLKVFASTSRRMRLKCSLSTRNRWQLFSFKTIVAALWKGGK